LNFDSWRHAVNAQAIKSKTSGTTTSEAIGWSWQSDYTINETDYIFGITAIDKDEFSTYDQQTRIAFGYGRRVIDLERHVLNAEVGFGSRQADLRNKTSQDGAILRWSGDYRWIISDVSEFNQTLSVEGGADNVFLESSSALSTNVRENLALVTSFAIKSNSDVLPGSKKTDTFTAISLEYTF
jgi:putative salt-induced outer membrane protein